MAPLGCVVCGKKHPGINDAPGWTYLAGADPVGAMTCGPRCFDVAVKRHMRGERVDGKDSAN